MKKLVAFEGYNSMEYYGHHMIICESKDNAEFQVVLREDDKIVSADEAVFLVRDGIWYSQNTKMDTFKDVSFFAENEPTITLKLLKI